jgi:hypothetical protein
MASKSRASTIQLEERLAGASTIFWTKSELISNCYESVRSCQKIINSVSLHSRHACQDVGKRTQPPSSVQIAAPSLGGHTSLEHQAISSHQKEFLGQPRLIGRCPENLNETPPQMQPVEKPSKRIKLDQEGLGDHLKTKFNTNKPDSQVKSGQDRPNSEESAPLNKGTQPENNFLLFQPPQPTVNYQSLFNGSKPIHNSCFRCHHCCSASINCSKINHQPPLYLTTPCKCHTPPIYFIHQNSLFARNVSCHLINPMAQSCCPNLSHYRTKVVQPSPIGHQSPPSIFQYQVPLLNPSNQHRVRAETHWFPGNDLTGKQGVPKAQRNLI